MAAALLAASSAERTAGGLSSVAHGAVRASTVILGGAFAAPSQASQFRSAPAQERMNRAARAQETSFDAPEWYVNMFRVGPNDPRARINYAPTFVARKDFAPSWYEQMFRAGPNDPRMISLFRALGPHNPDPRQVSLRAVLTTRLTWADVCAGRVAAGRTA